MFDPIFVHLDTQFACNVPTAITPSDGCFLGSLSPVRTYVSWLHSQSPVHSFYRTAILWIYGWFAVQLSGAGRVLQHDSRLCLWFEHFPRILARFISHPVKDETESHLVKLWNRGITAALHRPRFDAML